MLRQHVRDQEGDYYGQNDGGIYSSDEIIEKKCVRAVRTGGARESSSL